MTFSVHAQVGIITDSTFFELGEFTAYSAEEYKDKSISALREAAKWIEETWDEDSE